MKPWLCFLLLTLCIMPSLVHAQDSLLNGTIKVKKQSDTTAIYKEEPELDGPHDLVMQHRVRGGIYHHGPLIGLDYSTQFGYRAGFQYSDPNFVLRLCFRHMVSEKLAGASAAVELPFSTVFGRSSSLYTYRIGTEWTSLGRSNNWYQSLNFYLSKVFVLGRGPNIILNAGYQLNPVKSQTENISISGFSSSLILHF